MPKKDDEPKKVSFSDYPLAAKFMPRHQKNLVQRYEDGDKKSILEGIEKTLKNLKGYGSQDGLRGEAMVYAHYFRGQSDWFITETDFEPGQYENLFGFTILNGDTQFAELGSVSLSDLVNDGRVELDFFWTPKTLKQAKAEAYPSEWGEEKPTAKFEPIEEQPEPAAPEEAEPTPMPAPPVESPAAIEAAITAVMPKICAVTRNMQQNGVEIRFPKQPAEGLTAQLKAKGFRWSRNKGVWYVKYTESIHKWALEFCGSTEHTDNPGSIETPKGGRVRLITRAALTSTGKVPQTLLKSEIEAGKLEMAFHQKWDSYQDMYDHIPESEREWKNATMDARSVDIEELAKGNANKYWKNYIRLKDDGMIQYGSLYFRYKTDVENHDYTPQSEIEKEQEAKAAQEKVKTELVSQIVDLNPARYHVPSNRPAKKGDFEIEYEEVLNPTDFIGKGEIPGIVAIDGYRLVGTMEAQNVVTSVMMAMFGNQRTENREDKWIFKAEKGTATPPYLSYAKFRQPKEGEKSDFPGWIAPSSPHDVWDSLKWAVSEAVTELNKSKDPKKTDRGRKGHANKAAVSIQRITLIKKIWVEYELKYPGRLIQVTGQSAYEYAKMMSLWMADLDMKVAEVAPVVETVPTPENKLRVKEGDTVKIVGLNRVHLGNGQYGESAYNNKIGTVVHYQSDDVRVYLPDITGAYGVGFLEANVIKVAPEEASKEAGLLELKSRLKLLTKMVEKAEGEKSALLKTRIKLITKMIGNG